MLNRLPVIWLMSNMNDVEEMKDHVTADAVASGGVLPQPIPVGWKPSRFMSGVNRCYSRPKI